jgi:Ferredoxin-like domain in Api92-like protein
MPNHVSNKLEIHCEDNKTMNKIRMMIFDEDENNKQIFTMSKMLPLPARFSGKKEYNDFGYDWCRAIWGTKWDVYDEGIFDSGDSITIYYHTAWSPNDNWVESLCIYIQKTITHLKAEDRPSIYVKLQYHDYLGDFGGIMEWVPFDNPKRQSYSFMEYAKQHDAGLYECAIEYDKMRRGVM